MTEPRFLGRGWAFPPSFAPGGADVEMVSGADDVHQCLEILMATDRGERLMHEDFGCGLQAVMFEEIDHGLVNRINQLVSSAVLEHEPRVRLEGVDVTDTGSGDGHVTVLIDYTIRATNSRYNLVFPFYIDEARAPGAGP